jgi:hypothetical protein
MKHRLLSYFFLAFLVSCSNEKKEQPVANDPIKKETPPQAPIKDIYNLYTQVDVSPMDMTYFPIDYPKLKMEKAVVGPLYARVIYSRPHLQGRKLFNEVLKYEEPWRLGANEATELQLFREATIQGQKIPAGRYVLYCIPHKETWTIVLNSNIDVWGLHQDSTKDITRFEVPISPSASHSEYFTMLFEKKGEGADLLMAWDGVEARLNFNF